MNRMGHTKRGKKSISSETGGKKKMDIDPSLSLRPIDTVAVFFSFFFSKSNYTLAATVCQHTNEHLLLLSFYRSLGEGGRHRFPPLAQLVAFRGDRIGGGARRRPASRR